MRRLRPIAGIFLAIVAILGAACSFLHYTTPGEVGIEYNLLTGETTLDHPGWNVTRPWVFVAHADTRPMRVCITSAGRGYSCRLVEFQKERFREFLAVEGFRYYWFSNRISFNLGYDEEYRGFRDLMRGYAFSAKPYDFLVVLNDYVEPSP